MVPSLIGIILFLAVCIFVLCLYIFSTVKDLVDTVKESSKDITQSNEGMAIVLSEQIDRMNSGPKTFVRQKTKSKNKIVSFTDADLVRRERERNEPS